MIWVKYNIFFGMQVKESSSGILNTQINYVDYLLIIFSMKYGKPVGTPTIVGCKLMKEDSTPLVDATLYRYLVSSLIHITTTRHCKQQDSHIHHMNPIIKKPK